MGNMFGGGGDSSPEKLFGVKVNASELGHPVTVVMGCAKTNQTLLWIDGFTASSAGGKKGGGGGKGGGKGGQYIYSADVIAAVSAGPIKGIGDVWSGQSWLGSPTAAESYTITAPDYSYTPNNGSGLVNNYGVSPTSTYSSTQQDYLAPGSTTVSNAYSVPFIEVSYGTTLSSGEYSIDPAGTYHFASEDAGIEVTAYYSYLLSTINQQENDLIPTGRTIAVGGAFQFNADLGVVYGGTGSNTGKALIRVGNPTATGTYSQSGSAPATYTFAPGDVGAEVTITYQVNDPDAVGQNQSNMLDFTTAEGTIGQAPYSFLLYSYPGASLGYSGVATVLYEPMDLGEGGEPQQNSFEVITPDGYGGGILDCNPVTCITRVLTDTQWGLGVGAVPFPTSVIDSGAGGTWGLPGTPNVQQTGTSAWNWFAANNFFISPVLDSQDSAASQMSKWLEAGTCAAFVSEGMLKLVPYGDTTTAANGCTWSAPSTYIVALDDTCFLAKEGVDPVSIKRSAWQDAYNDVSVQWSNRHNQYSQEVTQESDQSLINRYGSRIEDPQSWDFIRTLPAATFAASMRLKRGTYIRNEYTFSLPYTYSYLEPMDIVTMTTSSVWAAGLNNANLGITNLPVRITKVVDNPTDGLQCTAEDYPFGTGAATLFNKGLSQGEIVANLYADPGTAEVVLFEATGRLTGYRGNEIWLGACGTSANYGSTNVWVSQDNLTYLQVATLEHPAVLGRLAAPFASGTDPDTNNSLVVALAENCPPLGSGTTTAADNDTMLLYVDGEVISYSAAALTAQNTYTMGTYIRRGQLGTPITAHASGSLMIRLDGAIAKYQYDPTWQGKTVYFKFQAVNQFGNNPRPLSSIAAIAFEISNSNTGAIDASSGLLTTGAQTPIAPSGTLVASAFSPAGSGGASIAVNSFTALYGVLSVPILPAGGYTITGLDQQAQYFVYFTDPSLAGGAVTPIATKNMADYLGCIDIFTSFAAPDLVQWKDGKFTV